MGGQTMSQPMEEERLSRDAMSELQLDLLKRTLTYAQENVDFYRRLFQEHGVHSEEVQSLDAIADLPFTKKSDLVKNYPYGS
jgi:phenylacetate-CoA ligase